MLRKSTLSILLGLSLVGFSAQHGIAETFGGAAEAYWEEDPSGGEIPGRLVEGARAGLLRLLIGSCTGMGEHSYIDGRLAFLKTELGITDAQKNSWNNYSDSLRRHLENVRASVQATRTAMVEGKAPGERLNTRISSIENRLKSLKDLKPAFDRLYESLSQEQRTKADELAGSVGCMR